MTAHYAKIRQLNHELLEELMITLFQLTEANQAAITALQTQVAAIVPSDPTAAINAAIVPLQAQINDLAALVGTPAA